MTQRPRHLVNELLVLTDEPLPETTAVDLALSMRRIEGLHGAPVGARYRHFVGRALAAQPVASRDDLLTLAALAAWRAGAPAFRTDALARLERALAGGGPGPAALAAALGLGDGGVAPFAELQRSSRFGWPGLQSPGELLAVIGGFRGLFGPWLAPPVLVRAGERPGNFLIRTGRAAAAEDWQLSVDVFGHTLVRLTADETAADETAAEAAEAAAEAPWVTAGITADGIAESGAAGAVLRIHGYTAELRIPGGAA